MCEVRPDTIKGRNSSTIIIGDFNILLSGAYRITRQKTKKDIEDMNNIIQPLNLIDLNRIPSQQL